MKAFATQCGSGLCEKELKCHKLAQITYCNLNNVAFSIIYGIVLKFTLERHVDYFDPNQTPYVV